MPAASESETSLNIEPATPKLAKGNSSDKKPDRAEAEAAIRTLLLWAGEDPDREGLRDTPARVARAYDEFFRGYAEDPVAILARTFEEIEGYDEMVVLRDISARVASEAALRELFDATLRASGWPDA